MLSAAVFSPGVMKRPNIPVLPLCSVQVCGGGAEICF